MSTVVWDIELLPSSNWPVVTHRVNIPRDMWNIAHALRGEQVVGSIWSFWVKPSFKTTVNLIKVPPNCVGYDWISKRSDEFKCRCFGAFSRSWGQQPCRSNSANTGTNHARHSVVSAGGAIFLPTNQRPEASGFTTLATLRAGQLIVTDVLVQYFR